MKILVTGAAGFIGSYVTDILVSQGIHTIFTVDDLSNGYLSNLNPKAHFTRLDLRDKTKTNEYVSSIKPHLIYHLAADATEGRSHFTPLSSVECNLNAYLNTLIPAIRHQLKKVVLISSMSVYGDQKPPFSESMSRTPVDIYGIAKSAMEQSTEVLSHVHGFKYVTIRPHNVYGPRQNIADPYRNVIGIFINRLLHGKPYYIYGDGTQKRAFTYINDCAPYIVESGFTDTTDGEAINIGPRKEYTINEMSDILLSIFFKDKQIPKSVRPKYVDARPQEVKYAFCTSTKAEQLLSYKSSINLSEGIKYTVAWAETLGPQQFKYLDTLEIQGKKVPITWRNKLLT